MTEQDDARTATDEKALADMLSRLGAGQRLRLEPRAHSKLPLFDVYVLSDGSDFEGLSREERLRCWRGALGGLTLGRGALVGETGAKGLQLVCVPDRTALDPGEGEFSWVCPQCNQEYEVREGELWAVGRTDDF